METFIYFGKVILCSAVMFGYYHLALKDKTFHHYNRFYLLSVVAVSLLLPLLKISYFTIEVNKNFYLLLNSLQTFNSTKHSNNDFIYPQLTLLAFGVVAFVFLIRLLIGLFKISTFKKQFPKEEIQGVSVYNTNLESAPFSYFKNLFWKNSILLNSDLGRQILKHEMVHIEQKHSFDKLFMELVTAILWFNPLFWFIKREINLIHEYLADKKAVQHMDTKAFAQMLLTSHFSGTVIPATSPFLSSNLKKRLKMLQKPNTKFGYAHRILALPVVFTLAFAYMVNAKNKEIEKSNQEIEKAVSQLKKDTVKTSGTAVAVMDTTGELSVDEKLMISTDKSLFIINGDEVSRTEFIKQYKDNLKTEKMSLSYSSAEGNEHLYKEFGVLGPYGKFEKYGVFILDYYDDEKHHPEKYWKIQDKYAPEWRQYIKSLEKPENRARLDRIMAEKDAETAIKDAAFAIKDAEIARKDAELAAKDALQAQKDAELVRKQINSKEFKKEIESAKKEAVKAEKAAAIARRASEKAKKDAEIAMKDHIKAIEKHINILKKDNSVSKEHIQKIEKHLETLKSNPSSYKADSSVDLGVRTINIEANENQKIPSASVKTKTYHFVSENKNGKLKYYLDGKEITTDELTSAFPVKDIKSVHVEKNNDANRNSMIITMK